MVSLLSCSVTPPQLSRDSSGPQGPWPMDRIRTQPDLDRLVWIAGIVVGRSSTAHDCANTQEVAALLGRVGLQSPPPNENLIHGCVCLEPSHTYSGLHVLSPCQRVQHKHWIQFAKHLLEPGNLLIFSVRRPAKFAHPEPWHSAEGRRPAAFLFELEQGQTDRLCNALVASIDGSSLEVPGEPTS